MYPQGDADSRNYLSKYRVGFHSMPGTSRIADTKFQSLHQTWNWDEVTLISTKWDWLSLRVSYDAGLFP